MKQMLNIQIRNIAQHILYNKKDVRIEEKKIMLMYTFKYIYSIYKLWTRNNYENKRKGDVMHIVHMVLNTETKIHTHIHISFFFFISHTLAHR